MKNRSVAPLAVFLDLELFALFLLVDCCSVIAAFALGASESDDVCHVKFFPFRMNLREIF